MKLFGDMSENELDAPARSMMEAAFFSKRDRALVVARVCVQCGERFEDEIYEALKGLYSEEPPLCLVCDMTGKALELANLKD